MPKEEGNEYGQRQPEVRGCIFNIYLFYQEKKKINQAVNVCFMADELSGTESDPEESSKGQCLPQVLAQRTLVYSSLNCISNQQVL